MPESTGANLHRLMADAGLSVCDVARRTGLDQRTLRGILGGTKRPHVRTLQRLAEGLDVPIDRLLLPATFESHQQRFDEATNPVVAEVVLDRPALFEDWTADEFHELQSRVGTGGALTTEGVAQAAAHMNRKRQLHEKLDVLLESSRADLVSSVIELAYREVIPDEQGSN